MYLITLIIIFVIVRVITINYILMINQEFKSVIEVLKAFPNEETCISHLESVRWNGSVISPFDPYSKVYSCKNKKYRCRNSGKYFNVKTGTVFYNSRIELQKWFVAIWIVTSSKKGITSVELSKDLNITQKTAWFMIDRIKKYIELERKMKNKEKKAIQIEKTKAIEVVLEEKKLQMLDWLKLMKQ